MRKKDTFDVVFMIFGLIMVGVPVVGLAVGAVFDMDNAVLLGIGVSSIWIFHAFL